MLRRTDLSHRLQRPLRRAIAPLLLGGALAYVLAWLVQPSLYLHTVLVLAPLQIALAGLGLLLDRSREHLPLRLALILMASMAVVRLLVLSGG